MKKITLLTLLLTTISLSSCLLEGQSPEKVVTTETSKYMGSWFEIKYPASFVATPSEPVENFEDITFIETDEASFIGPNDSVEFFVYSPQWDGEPKDYLTIKQNEKIIDEETKEEGEQIKKTVKIQDKDQKYFREYESIKDFVGTGSEVHHVFGIRYKNKEIFSQYKDSYENFKASLVQFAD